MSNHFDSDPGASDAVLLPRRINLFPLVFLRSGERQNAIPADIGIEAVRATLVGKLRGAGAVLRRGERGYGFLADAKMVISHPASDVIQMAHTVRFSLEPLAGQLYLALDPTVSVKFLASVDQLIKSGIQASQFEDLLAWATEAEALEDDDETPLRQSEHASPYFIKRISDQEGVLVAEVLDNEADQIRSINASDLYLTPTQASLGLVADHLRLKEAFIKAHRKSSLLEGEDLPRKRLQRARNHANNLIEKSVFPLTVNGVEILLRKAEISVSDDPFDEAKTLPEPILQFDPEDGSRSHQQPYHGLRNYGPYHRGKPVINIVLMGPSERMGKLREFVGKLNEGSGPLPGGSKRFLHCELRSVGEMNVQGTTGKAYEQAAARVAENYGTQDPVVLCLLPGKTDPDKLDTPYYGAKTKLASRGICSQMITFEKLGNQWAQPDILMGIYAKSGSVPWALNRSDPSFDLILGIDVAIPLSQNRQIGDKKRYIGTASVFNGRGVWLNQINTHQRYQPGKSAAQMAK